MIFIGLDVSKISTALCIEKDNEVKLYSYTTKKSNNIWIENTKDFINYRNICYKYDTEKDYSKSELIKLNEFNSITDLIIADIFDSTGKKDKIRIAIEGYSYNSKGPIFDLIEFTTTLKIKLMKKIKNHNDIIIYSPLTLKTETCKMVYEPRTELKGKKKIKTIYHYENTKGKQATKFDKWDMFFSFIDSDINMEIKEWCKQHQTEITKIKEVPKPIDDIIDAIFLKEMIKKLGGII